MSNVADSHTFISSSIGRKEFILPMPSVQEAIRRNFNKDKYLQCVYASLQPVDNSPTSRDPNQSINQSLPLDYGVQVTTESRLDSPLFTINVDLGSLFNTAIYTVINAFNNDSYIKARNIYRRLPAYFDWIPDDLIDEDLSNATEVAQVRTALDEVTPPSYSSQIAPPSSNVMYLYEELDIEFVRLRFFVAPHTTIVFQNGAALKQLGFVVQSEASRPNVYVNDTSEYLIVTAAEAVQNATIRKNYLFSALVFYNDSIRYNTAVSLPVFDVKVNIPVLEILFEQLYSVCQSIPGLNNFDVALALLSDTQMKLICPAGIRLVIELSSELIDRLKTNSTLLNFTDNVLTSFEDEKIEGFQYNESDAYQKGIVVAYQSDLTEKNYPGKVAFKLIPSKHGWSLFDSHYLPNPYHFNTYDLNQIKVNPIKLKFCFYDVTGRPQPLSIDPMKLQCIFMCKT